MSTTTPKVKLWLSSGNITVLMLSIPLDKCSTFAFNPLKWLRFLGFAIYGREGYLSTSKAGPEIDDYTADIEPRSYYFFGQGEARFLDADVLDDRTSNASDLSSRRNDFRTNLIERDGTCVITGDLVGNCDACHIIPHSKGNEYISNAIHHRGGTDVSANDIDDINDTRNGLLLSVALYRQFGAGNIAFLKTPNFALTASDIPYQPPGDPPASRLTLHHFVQLGPMFSLVAPHNSDARQPQDTSECPPAIILDLIYATAALNAWSPKSFKKYIREQSRDAYYDDCDNQDDGNLAGGNSMVSGQSHVDARLGDQTGQSQSGGYGLRPRKKMASIPPKERRFADLIDGVSALWMQSARVNKPKLEDAHALSLTRNESVKMWLKSMEGDTTN